MLQATKTEYRGIVFRSKSEAVFARCLDLSQIVMDWTYEPDIENFGPHPWDFLVLTCHVERCPTCCESTLNRYRQVLIEYKPSEPTLIYVKNLIERVRSRVNAYEKKSGCENRTFDSYVVHGNPWAVDYDLDGEFAECPYFPFPIFSDWAEYGWGDFDPIADHGSPSLLSSRHDIEEILGIYASDVHKAMQFRFDLK